MGIGRYVVRFCAIGTLGSGALGAQQPLVSPGSELDAYIRVLELDGGVRGAPLVFRPLGPAGLLRLVANDSGHLWSNHYPLASIATRSEPRIVPLDARIRATYLSAYPRGVNDGAVWTGRGATIEAAAGAQLAWGPFTATLYPLVFFAQNRDFAGVPVTRPGSSPYAYPWSERIDWPQRYGQETYSRLDWGQSGLRLNLGALTAGLSTENMWWGPADRWPILMSNTAAGFPHVDAGLGRPVAVGVGLLETRLVWGRLSRSAYFDTVTTDLGRLFTGLTLALAPRWLPGLTVGLARVFYLHWDSLGVRDFLPTFQTVFKEGLVTPENPEGNDRRDQLLSLYGRWLLPKSGFEVYVEWARNDHSANLRDFLMEPDHSQALTAGFQKTLPAGGARLRFRGEWAHLERSRTFQVRGSPVYYEHHIVREGYTHRGQLLGAGIGPGSSGQFLGLDRYGRRGRLSFYLERVRYDNDAYYALFGPTQTYHGHDVELTVGVSALRFVGALNIGGAIALSRELNRQFETDRDATNLRLEAALAWRPQR